MKKRFYVFAGILVLAIIVFGISMSNSGTKSLVTGNSVLELTGEKVPIKVEESSFKFEAGKVVGKPHPGTFEEWSGNVYLDENGEVSGIEGVAKISSVKTDSERVDSHLQRADFFDSENYPEIRVTSTKVDLENSKITGILEIKGIQKELTIPANFEENRIYGNYSLKADDFFLYDAIITEVKIEFDFVY